MADLADGSVIYPKDPGLNLGIEINYFFILFYTQICRVITLEHYMLILTNTAGAH
jgi:hypothetical protein